MSEATANPTAPAQTTSEATAPAAAPAKPPAGSPALADFYAKQALAARLADVADAEKGMEAAKAGDEPAETATPERGKDGKFKPKAGKEAKKETARADSPKDAPEKQPEGKESPDPEEPPPAAAVGGGLGKARQFVREGDIAKALELIGLSPERLEGKQWGAFRQRESKAVERERAAVAREQHLEQVARQLEQHYARFEQAVKAYQEEDYDSAFKLAFNEAADDYQRKRIASMTSKKDPEVAQLKKQLREFEQRQAAAQEQAARQRAEAERVSAQEAYKGEIAQKLSESEDDRFARVAQKKAFIQKVYDIQAQHYNTRTDETIDLVEAAELAWDELYEGVAGQSSTTAAPSASKPAGAAKTPVRQAAKAATTLNPHEAAEAAPATKLKPGSPEMLAYYARKAELAMLKETG